MGNIEKRKDAKRHLLLVEDQPLIATAEKMQLMRYGYKVTVRHSSSAALQLFEGENDIDLILMDIDLGRGDDGTLAAEKILKNHDIPLIFLTSHTETEVVARTEKISSYGFVVKDSGITVLDASIKMAFKLKEAFDRENQREQHLLRTQEMLEIAQSINKLGYWVLDIENDFLEWSDEVYKLFDIEKSEFQPSYEAFLGFVHPDDRSMVDKAYKDSINNKKEYNIVHRIKSKDGKVKYVREKCYTDFDTTGKAIRSIGTVQDITETLEGVTVTSIDSRIIDCINEAIFTTDLNFKVLSWNSAAEKIYGWQRDDAIGKLAVELIGQAFPHNCLEILEDNNSWEGVLDQKRKDESVVDVFSKISYLHDDDNNVVGLVAVNRDTSGKSF